MEVSKLRIKKYINVLENLEKVLAPSFGPCGKQALISTNCGSYIVTKAGRTIIKSCFMPHPVTKWVKERVKGHEQTTGDNCKSFILLLLEIFRRITAHHSHSGGPNLNSFGGLSLEKFCQEVSPSFSCLANDILPQTVLSVILKSDMCIKVSTDDIDAFWEIAKELIHSSLQGNLPEDCARLLGDLIVEFVQSVSYHHENLADRIHFVLKNFSLLCQEVGGFPVSESHTLAGVLISRDFLYYDSSLHLTEGAIMVVLMACEFNTDYKTADVNVLVSKKDQIEAVVTSNETKWSRFVARLQKLDIKVLLSVEVVPEQLVALCRQAGISVIHSVFLEELSHISDRIDVPLLYDLDDAGIPAVKVNFCKRVILGKEAFTNFGFMSKNGAALKHLVVCSPTASLCRSYTMVIQNSLRNLLVCLEGEIESTTDTSLSQGHQGEKLLYIVHGGGAVELTAGDVLKKWAGDCRDDKLSFVALCFAEALEVIPQMLHENSYKADGKRFLEGKLKRTKGGNDCRGINARTGCWQPSSELGIIESLASKLHLWQNVLDTFCDLVRLDAVVGVKTSSTVCEDGSFL